jgi:general secretion pathway protein L
MVLPLKAREFIDGIVRAQIDRIAPWNADQAIYGWKLSPDQQAEQISLVIAVASRGLITPYVNILQSFGARSVAVLVAAAGETIGEISIFDVRFDGVLTTERVRDGLSRALKIASIIAVFALASSILVEGWLARERAELTQRIAILQKSARSLPMPNTLQAPRKSCIERRQMRR